MLQNVMFMMFSCRLLKSSSLAILLTSTAAVLKKSLTIYCRLRLRTDASENFAQNICMLHLSQLALLWQQNVTWLTTAPILLSCSKLLPKPWILPLTHEKKSVMFSWQKFQECGYYMSWNHHLRNDKIWLVCKKLFWG